MVTNLHNSKDIPPFQIVSETTWQHLSLHPILTFKVDVTPH